MRPYRTVRHVAAGPEAPWAATLVRLESGESRFLVDAVLLPAGWGGWDAGANGHVLAPLDVVRRANGHQVAIFVCTIRVEAFLERRRTSRAPLSAGESVTLAVSMIRGLIEIGGERAAEVGEWWLTDAGRPVLVPGVGGASAREATLAGLDELSADRRDASVWHGFRDAVAADPSGRSLDRVEERLFAYSAAEPLRDAASQPAPDHSSVMDPMTLERVRRQGVVPAAPDEPSRGLVSRLVHHVDADVGDLVAKSLAGAWRKVRARPAPRGRPWLLAGAVAVVVVVAGVFWPTDSPAPAATNAPEAVETASSAPTSSPTPSPTVAAAAPDELTAITSALLDARSECSGDRECLAGYVVDPAASFPPGVIDADDPDRSVQLVDEFGGVAVLRVSAEGRESQLVVIQRQEDRWLLRDVYVAQQP